jgi:oligopeptidase A
MSNHNPLLAYQGLPPFEEIKAEHVEPAANEVIAECEKAISQIETEKLCTWDNIFYPLQKMAERWHQVWGPVSHLHSVANSPELREAYQKVLPKFVSLGLRLNQSESLYKAAKALAADASFEHLDCGQQRAIHKHIQEAELAGIGLDGPERAEFNQISERLKELETTFGNNVLDATKAFGLVLNTREQIKGLPPSFLAMSSEAYRQKFSKDSSAEDGPWLVTLDAPSVIPFLEYAEVRELREEVYRAYITRASSGSLDNSPLIEELLKLRKRKAELLGYQSFAEVSLARKMAGNVAAVYDLEDKLLQACYQKGCTEHDELLAFAKKNGAEYELAHWDIAMWSRKLQEATYGYDDEQLRPYFPLDQVLQGMFALVERFLGVSVVAHKGSISFWHPDVRYYNVLNESGDLIAGFYLDPYTRPENKRGGAWMDECQSRFKHHDGSVTLPIAYLVCNFSAPVKEKPSLLTFSDVETLFHEFGHGLQHMLTRVDHLDVSGINGIEWDAVEIASQFMENWCYQNDTIADISKHYSSGEALPAELFKKVKAAKNFRAASGMLRQLTFGLVDMNLHHQHDPNGNESFQDVYERVAERTSVLKPLPENRFLCSFSHIFAGGYAAGYYGYKWAEVLSADAFAAFEEAGLDNPIRIKEVGKRYRDTILALGGSKHPAEVFREFRGRNPLPDALLRHCDLLPANS